MARSQPVHIDLREWDPTGNGTDPSGTGLPVQQTSGVDPDPIRVQQKVVDGQHDPVDLTFDTQHTPSGYSDAAVVGFRYAHRYSGEWTNAKNDPSGGYGDAHEFEWGSPQPGGGKLKIRDVADDIFNFSYVLKIQITKDADPNANPPTAAETLEFIVDPEIHNEDEGPG